MLFPGLCDVKIETLKDAKDLRSLPPYVPDFSVRAITPVQYLRIRRVHYLAARRTSSMMSTRSAEEQCHEEVFHTEWHRTVAANSISRNNSAAGMSDMAEENPSHLDALQKQAMASEGSLKDKFIANYHSASQGSAEGIPGSDLPESPKKKASADSIRTNSTGGSPMSVSSPRGDQKQNPPAVSNGSASEVVTVSVHNGRTCGGEDGDSGPLLPNSIGDGDLKASAVSTESESSPEEGGAIKGVEDKVPLVSCRDIRTTPSGQKGWGGEEDENSPLMSKEKGDGTTVKS